MSWNNPLNSRNQRPHSNDEHRTCPTAPTSLIKTHHHQKPVQQNVIESTTVTDPQLSIPPFYSQHHTTHSAMPPGPSDPAGGSMPIQGTDSLSASETRMNTDNQSSILRQQIKPDNHNTTNRTSLPGYSGGNTSTSTSSHALPSSETTSMLSSSSAEGHHMLSTGGGGARPKTSSSKVGSFDMSSSSQPPLSQTSAQHGVLSTNLQQTSSQTYTTSTGGAVLQTLRDPSHYEEISVIGNGKNILYAVAIFTLKINVKNKNNLRLIMI